MESAISDSVLFSKSVGARMTGSWATYIGDSQHAGTKEYAQLLEQTEKKLDCKPNQWDSTQT